MRRRLGVLTAAAIGLANGAYAGSSLTERLRGQLDNAPVVLEIACGVLAAAPCSALLEKIGGRTAPTGIGLRGVESLDAREAAARVCDGRSAAAIVPRDVAGPCPERRTSVIRTLFPCYALLVVKAGASFRGLDDVLIPGSDGKPRSIAASPSGQVTLAVLPRTRSNYVTVTQDSPDTALKLLAEGQIDAFFTVEPLAGALIERIRTQAGARGQPIYAVIEIRPDPAVFRLGDGMGHCLYRRVALDFGAAAPVATVSVDATMVLGATFRHVHARGGPDAENALGAAVDQTRAAILAEMKSSPAWQPSATLCR